MELLKRHLSALPDEQAREAFALDCGTTLGHMRNAIYSRGAKRLSPAVCSALHLRHGIPRWHMRPEDWHLIWPELIGAEGAPEVLDARQPVHLDPTRTYTMDDAREALAAQGGAA